MCKYCKGNDFLVTRSNDNVYLEIYGNRMSLLGKVNQTPIKKEYKIKYCPMCRD